MISGIKKVFLDPRCILRKVLTTCDFSWMPDRPYLKILYYAHTGRKLNLEHPAYLSEKMQWLKLYDRNPRYTAMVDKYEAKKIIAEAVGQEYVVPTLGVWDCAEDIDFDALPDQFVLKTTHDSGTAIVCKEKAKLDVAAVKQELRQSLQRKYFYWGREWPYKDVTPRIIAERYLEDEATGELRDYKWYCFHGEPKMLGIISGISAGAIKEKYFDCSFRQMEGSPNPNFTPEKPKTFEKMMGFASVLSQGIPFLRVDFYEADGKLYVGELTFFDGSGLDWAEPEGWDKKIGNWLILPQPMESKEKCVWKIH